MIWFVAGAAASLAGFAWAGWRPHPGRSLALIITFGGAALAFHLWSEPLIVFAWALGAGSLLEVWMRRGATMASVLPVLVSDFLVALALTAQNSASGSWDLPAAGDWRGGGIVVTIAAAARISSVLLAENRSELAIRSVSVWQGLFMAWWAGPNAAAVVAAVMLLVAVLVRSGQGRLVGLGVGGALGMAASGESALLAGGLILAGAAFALGERALSAGSLAGFPISYAAVTSVDPTFGGALLVVVLPACWFALASVLGSATPRGRTGRLLAVASVVLTAAGIRATGLLWIAASLVVALLCYRLLLGTELAVPGDAVDEVEALAHRSWVAVPAYACIALFAVVIGRLTIVGASTSFL